VRKRIENLRTDKAMRLGSVAPQGSLRGSASREALVIAILQEVDMGVGSGARESP